MTTITITIEHPDAEKIVRAAIESYALVQELHALYILESKPLEEETTTGRRRRADVHSSRARACKQASITTGAGEK